MFTLEQLQQAGALAGGYKRAAFTTAISVSNLQQMSKDEQATFNGTIVIDNCQWAATTQGLPIAKASTVYSCDGTRFGCYRRNQRMFLELELVENKLATKRQYVLPEKKKEGHGMAMEININKDLQDLSKSVHQDAAGSVAGMKSFSSDSKSETKPLTAAAAKRMETQRELDEIRHKIGTGSLVDRTNSTINNIKHGRLICFITKTDPSLRLGIKSIPKLDAEGKFIPKGETPAATLKKFAEGEKLPLKYAETALGLVFKHTKPTGKPVGAVIATPAGSEIDFTKLNGTGKIETDSSNKDMLIRFLDADSIHPYIACNYESRIMEHDGVLGARATWLNLRINQKKAKDKATDQKTSEISASLVPESKDGRTSLLTDGNFVPLKVYKTLAQQDLDAAGKATCNLLIESALKSKGYGVLDDTTKALVHQGEDGSYTSEWFDNNKAINVEKYDKSGSLTNVVLPVMEKVPKKSGSGFVYRYQYFDIDDAEHGPMSLPLYQQIIALTGKSPEEFKEAVRGFGQRKRSGSGSANTGLTADEYLRAICGKGVTVAGAADFATLQKKLEGLA